jgi:hypothetical protein
MLRELFEMILMELKSIEKKGSEVNNKTLELIEEIEKLEIKQASALAEVERWGISLILQTGGLLSTIELDE